MYNEIIDEKEGCKNYFCNAIFCEGKDCKSYISKENEWYIRLMLRIFHYNNIYRKYM